MIEEIVYTRDEIEHQQKREAIKQRMQLYIHGNPETQVFCFFLPSDQGIRAIKHAAATLSLSTGKRIDVIYPTRITKETEHVESSFAGNTTAQTNE